MKDFRPRDVKARLPRKHYELKGRTPEAAAQVRKFELSQKQDLDPPKPRSI